jgi:3-deoxy-D-manno-octulosonic-acid transferase
LIAEFGLTSNSWSALDQIITSSQVVLVDAMGVLIKCYQIADIAIVAGSFTERVGGHNILEPCYFGVPTLCGPYMHTQKQLLDTALAFNAVLQVNETTLGPTLQALIASPVKRHEIGKCGLEMVETLKGATERTIAAQKKLTPYLFRIHPIR